MVRCSVSGAELGFVHAAYILLSGAAEVVEKMAQVDCACPLCKSCRGCRRLEFCVGLKCLLLSLSSGLFSSKVSAGFFEQNFFGSSCDFS